MTLQEATSAALAFEKKVRDHYQRGASELPDDRGRRVFATLAREEQGHVDYLERCLSEWKKSGKVPDVPLESENAPTESLPVCRSQMVNVESGEAL